MKYFPQHRLLIAFPVVMLMSLFSMAMVPAFAGMEISEFRADEKVLASTEKGEFVFVVELADTEEKRQVGLMNRKLLAEMSGMLFRFDTNRPVAMWMKNTFVPLDMIFTDENGKITHIHKGAVPESLEIIRSNGPARFVLELNAGEADSTGLKRGITLKHPWFSSTR